MTSYNPIQRQPLKRPVGRPKKPNRTSDADSSSSAARLPREETAVEERLDNPDQQDSNGYDSGNDCDSNEPVFKKKRGQYKSYSLDFKLTVIRDLYQGDESITSIANKYNLPRSTIHSWDCQLRQKK